MESKKNARAQMDVDAELKRIERRLRFMDLVSRAIYGEPAPGNVEETLKELEGQLRNPDEGSEENADG